MAGPKDLLERSAKMKRKKEGKGESDDYDEEKYIKDM